MTLEEIEAHARRLMKNFGLSDEYWEFRFNRSRRRYGQCSFVWIDLTGTFRKKGRIELSKPFCLVNPFEITDDCIRHEIAHALAGPHAKHGPKWVEMCKVTGARPEICGSGNIILAARWQARCFNCGKVHHRYRRPNVAMNYHCISCGPERGTVYFREVHLKEETRAIGFND